MSQKMTSGWWSAIFESASKPSSASTTWHPACTKKISALRRIVLLSSMIITLMPLRFATSANSYLQRDLRFWVLFGALILQFFLLHRHYTSMAYISTISKSSLRAPHSGQTQFIGTSRQHVPAGIFSSGRPFASSYMKPQVRHIQVRYSAWASALMAFV